MKITSRRMKMRIWACWVLFASFGFWFVRKMNPMDFVMSTNKGMKRDTIVTNDLEIKTTILSSRLFRIAWWNMDMYLERQPNKNIWIFKNEHSIFTKLDFTWFQQWQKFGGKRSKLERNQSKRMSMPSVLDILPKAWTLPIDLPTSSNWRWKSCPWSLSHTKFPCQEPFSLNTSTLLEISWLFQGLKCLELNVPDILPNSFSPSSNSTSLSKLTKFTKVVITKVVDDNSLWI